ncbi:MAG: multidrug efflux RND transporter permease subunit [Deltaproteobacteria bacterium]|jgi:hydrophobe/amphiphile efflux-1 (HAE1) family protein|nr:multidrug efflux RND transporter permease subunit [Deltaproteobacteria bacterium]
MFVNFFIKRPIFSTVISLVIVLAGAVCIPLLPIAQFPNIAPPTVQVAATYTGASAEVVEKTVTQPLEEQINGVEGMTYMSSTSSGDGSSKITVTFDIGYDLDIAAVDVQNRVQIGLPQVPEDVRRYGVTTQKQSTNFILIANLFSPEDTYDDLFLSNYAKINIVDVLKRIPGVGDVQIFGERKYSMRFWIDPDRLTGMNLTIQDVIVAIQDQNIQVAAGGIGQPPSTSRQVFQYTISTQGRLEEVSEFEDIIVRTDTDGAVVRIKDIAKVELGAENYQWYFNLNGKSCAGIGVFQLADANAVQIADQVRSTMKELSKRFPDGMEYIIPYDTTMFVKESIKEVLITLILAIILVVGVIYIFLQDWRSTLIPCVTIPVSLIGTFGIMMAFGFSINTLTLFGLVLAIGTVVDDAIVVVENTSRIIEEEGLTAMDAAMKSMSEVTGPVIATSLVLFAVFVPVAFMPGISGALYQQFALTIAFSVAISTICALTISPAMCAIFLQKKGESKNFFFNAFNKGFDISGHAYERMVNNLIKKWKIIVVFFFVMLGLTLVMFKVVPTAFIPDEDQGYFFIVAQGPEGTSLKKTQVASGKIEKIARSMDGVADVLTIGGYNLMNQALDSSTFTAIVTLYPWGERKSPDLSVTAIMQKINYAIYSVNEVSAFAFNPPAIQGLSQTGGFQFELQDVGDGEIEELNNLALKMIQMGRSSPELAPLSTTFKMNYPQFYIDLDRTKAKTLGIQIATIFDTLQAYLGSFYVNDFNKFGRVYRVFIQAEPEYRSNVTDISQLYVRSGDGDLIPLSALIKINRLIGPQTISHYNLFRNIELNGNAAPGHSSGESIDAMQKIAGNVLPDGYSYEWSGTALQEIMSGGMAPFIFALALAFVFLFLAAQYESWSLPVTIMIAVPLAILGALIAQWWRGLYNDVYCQIGLVMLIGLASKNSILLVEFAKERIEEGMTSAEAAIMAAKTRLRPILMTAFSFILGAIPLVVASGAGAASRHSLGTAVMGGMIAATFLTLGIVPVLFVVIVEGAKRGITKSDFQFIGTKAIVGSKWLIDKIKHARKG